LQQVTQGKKREYTTQALKWSLNPGATKTTSENGRVDEVHSEEEFDSVLQHSSELVVVQFSAQWCGPCKLFAPIYERMAAEYSGRARFLKVDAKENESTNNLAKRFQVKGIPAFYFIRDGKVLATETGVKAEDPLRVGLNNFAY